MANQYSDGVNKNMVAVVLLLLSMLSVECPLVALKK